MVERIRVLLVDGQPAFTEVLSARLATESDLDVVGVASRHDHALALARLKHPHVALLDVGLPGQLELGIRLRAEAAELRLVVLTDVDDGPLALAAVRAGATAWVQKQAASSELVEALRGVVQGEARIPPRLLGLILLDLVATGSKAPAGPLDALSPREREVLQCMVDGLDRRQIADELLLSPNTVRTHMQNLLAKLNAHSGLEAVATGMRDGMRPRQEQVAKPSNGRAPADDVVGLVPRSDPLVGLRS